MECVWLFVIIKPNTTSLTSSCLGQATCSSAETHSSKQSQFTFLFPLSIILWNTCLHTEIFVLIHYVKNRMQYFQISCNADQLLSCHKNILTSCILVLHNADKGEKLWVIFPKIWYICIQQYDLLSSGMEKNSYEMLFTRLQASGDWNRTTKKQENDWKKL